jgi:glycosyltransferase involved in cell wall biosynthesis
MPLPEALRARHLLHVFSTFGIGGPQVRFAQVANGLGSKYRHKIVAMDGNYACAERLDPELDAVMVPMPIEKGRGLSRANLRSFRALLKRLRPDLLLTYNWGAVECALSNRFAPICRNVHLEDGFGPDEADGNQLARRVWMRRLALGGSTEIVVPSRMLERIVTQNWRLSPRRVSYIANGIDCDRFAQAPQAGLLNPKFSSSLLVGAVSGLRPEKNLARLVRAVAALPAELDAHLVLVGEGPERPAIEALACSLGFEDRILLTGAVANPEAVLGRFDVFAMSSDTEQMPISLLEAMAAGLPVVATDVGDIREMVAPENRDLIVDRSDETGFTAALAALLRDPERRRRLGEANRERARAEFDESRMIAAYDRLFEG